MTSLHMRCCASCCTSRMLTAPPVALHGYVGHTTRQLHGSGSCCAPIGCQQSFRKVSYHPLLVQVADRLTPVPRWASFHTAALPASAERQTEAASAAADDSDSSYARQYSISSAPARDNEQQDQQQQQHAAGGTKKKKKKKKQPPWPTMIHAGGSLPADPLVWQNAAVLIDKPLEWTSFDVCGKLRGALQIKKVGHAGTLDPQATGLLIICIGKGCKQVDNFVAMEKIYTGTLRLGGSTPSYDAETEVDQEAEWRHLTHADIQAARDRFLGDTLQLPPMYSAIKIKGKKLYLSAREGEAVERQPRPINVSQFDVWRDDPQQPDVHFRIACSKGTYIRSLAHDLGQALGSAAHLVALRREAIGEHSIENAWQLPELVEAISRSREELGIPWGKPLSVPG